MANPQQSVNYAGVLKTSIAHSLANFWNVFLLRRERGCGLPTDRRGTFAEEVSTYKSRPFVCNFVPSSRRRRESSDSSKFVLSPAEKPLLRKIFSRNDNWAGGCGVWIRRLSLPYRCCSVSAFIFEISTFFVYVTVKVCY